MKSRCFGKHRGKVESNLDPPSQDRLRVSVPGVLGPDTSVWAMPCVPYAGPDLGFLFLPPPGANVWIEFEAGDTRLPIWSGCFWGPGEAPSLDPQPTRRLLKTPAFELTVTEPPDAPAAAILEINHAAGHTITLGPTGITLTNGAARTDPRGP